MEAIAKKTKLFWDWFSSVDDVYFIFIGVLILIGTFFYVLKAFWDNEDKKAVASINAIFDSFKKSPVGKVAIMFLIYVGLYSNDTDNDNNIS